MTTATATATSRVLEYARQVVEYVQRAIGLELAYDSDTLPLLDHYLRSVPAGEPAAVELIATTSGAYFGEVVRRRLGGRWDTSSDDATEWRVVLTTGVNFSPAGFVAAAIVRAELDDLDTAIDAPPRMRPYLEQTLARMGEVTLDDYYSLCGRLDTLEHVHEVLVAVAAQMLGKRGPGDLAGSELSEDDVVRASGSEDVVPPPRGADAEAEEEEDDDTEDGLDEVDDTEDGAGRPADDDDDDGDTVDDAPAEGRHRLN
ncbi:MAG TPA: hypothetical protein VHE35_07900 [Kofleriaceae bacterium]|nr:hypothetical protein [Kofleriaceae bacterium]